MPVVRVDLLEGRTVEQKRKLAAAITDVVVEHADVAASQVRVVFTDHAPENWAVGGELIKDRRAKAAAEAAQAGLDGHGS
ncbi:MAG: 2-hydroxymuconate tautomerase family protein [Solirubrobacteraceae bacterium]|nr:2-hydroxymuconate tautomerase family protein [Patulibacter sp.]